MKKETVKAVGLLNKSYLSSTFRSVMEDIILSASNDAFVKVHDFDEFNEANSDSTLSKKEYYEVKGYALNVPTFEKGDALNNYLVEKFLKKYLNDEHMNSNYLLYRTAIEYMIDNPSTISDYYEIEETESASAIGKIMKMGHSKDGEYNDTGLEYMFNFDYYSIDENKKALDRIKRGVLVAQLTQSNISWLESKNNATDSLVVTGATLHCSVSGTTSTFRASTLGSWATVSGNSLGCIKDDSATNIGSFGYCPARDKECKFSSAGGWQNTDAMSFGGEDSITEKSYIQCSYGGTIKIQGSGQSLMKTNTKGSGK